MTFVLLQLLLRQCEHLFVYKRWHGHLDPLRARPLMVGTIAARQTFPLAPRACDSLSGPQFGFSIACRSTIGWVAQHAPNRGPFPAALPRPRCDLAFIQQTSN